MGRLKLVWTNDNPVKPPRGPYSHFVDFWLPFTVFIIMSFAFALFSVDSLFGLSIFSWFYFYNRGIAFTKGENFKAKE